MADERPCLYVCTTCKQDGAPLAEGETPPGRLLYEAVAERLSALGPDAPVDVAPVPAEGHERQVHGVQHNFHRQQNRDQVPAEEDAGGANREQHRGHDQVVVQGNHDSPSRRARTTAPTMATVLPDAPRQNTATYNKGDHADVMNDLLAMAFQCDVTRVITHMLEDERSEFTYDHVTKRTFTEAGSVETSGTCPEYHGGGQHGSQDDFATITWWNVG